MTKKELKKLLKEELKRCACVHIEDNFLIIKDEKVTNYLNELLNNLYNTINIKNLLFIDVYQEKVTIEYNSYCLELNISLTFSGFPQITKITHFFIFDKNDIKYTI